MKLPIQQTDIIFIKEIINEFDKIKERFEPNHHDKEKTPDIIATILGYENYSSMETEALEYILPYQTDLQEFSSYIKEKLYELLPDEVSEATIEEFIKTKFLPLKSLNTLIWKFEKHQIDNDTIYRVAISDIGKNAYIITSTFITEDDIDDMENLIRNFTKTDIKTFLDAKKTLGYNKMHLTLSEGIDDMLCEIVSSITFETAFINLHEEEFDFCEESKNTILLTLPALVRICGKDFDIYAYAFEKNEENTYFCVSLNEYYKDDLEIYLGDIIEVEGSKLELLPNPTLYRDLLIYHNSVEPSYTPEDLRACFASYCNADIMKYFDVWYNKFIATLNDSEQNFYATKIMNHLTNLLLNEKLFNHKNLYLIKYNEEQYKKYKRNEITLNRETFKIRKLIDNFLENFLKEKGIKINFIDFDEKDYFEFIKKEKMINNDQSKLKWIESKYIGDKKENKKLQDIGSFTLQDKKEDI